MGLILDTGVFVIGERRGLQVPTLLSSLLEQFNEPTMDISVVTIAELTHGIYRAVSPERARTRAEFVKAISDQLTIHSFTPPLAEVVGRIEGEQAALGNRIAFEDLVIGATALSLNFKVLTANAKHFQLIPGLVVLTF
jgi:predicted nucleic acid-binding protein